MLSFLRGLAADPVDQAAWEAVDKTWAGPAESFPETSIGTAGHDRICM
jgi:hypothetical protein